MADPREASEKRSIVPTFEVEISPAGIMLDVFGWRTVPQADLIQAMMNAGACYNFGLSPSFSTEGGVEGIYKKTSIQLTNWGDGVLGIGNEMWQVMDYMKDQQVSATDDVLGYYEVFLRQMFESPVNIEGIAYPAEVLLVNPNLQTRGAVWDKIMDTFVNIGGGRFPKQVRDYLIRSGEAGRRHLRGLTDEEIQRFFIEPPTE